MSATTWLEYLVGDEQAIECIRVLAAERGTMR
jgi:hypothetical protein